MGLGNSKVHDGQAPKPIMTEDRKCRDVLCIFIFVAWWVGMIACAYVGLTYGEPALLTHGVDYAGNVCGSRSSNSTCVPGVSGSCENKGVLTFPRIDQDMLAASQAGVNLADPSALSSIPFYGVCRTSCPNAETDKWVCSYENLAMLHSTYNGVAGSDIPSAQAQIVLDECLSAKQRLPGPFAAAFLSDRHQLSDGSYAQCRTLMAGCWKMYVPEYSLFYRCIPVSDDNSTCASSPYLESIGEAPSYILNSDGSTTPRKASHPRCGECLDPIVDESGAPMDPSSDFCRAKKTLAVSEQIKAVQNPLFSAINDWSTVLRESAGDVQLCSTEIVTAGGPGAMAVGVLWLVLLRFFAGIFVWITLWTFFFASLALTFQFFVYGGVITSNMLDSIFSEFNSTGLFTFDVGNAAVDLANVNVLGAEFEDQQQIYEYAGWTMLVFSVLVLLLIISMRKRIRIAVAVIKEASKAIAAMPMIMLFPVVTVSLTLGIAGYWGWIALHLSSTGSITAESINSTVALPILDARRRLLLAHQEIYDSSVQWGDDRVNIQPLSHLNNMDAWAGHRSLNANLTDALGDAAATLGVEAVNQFQSMDLGTQLWVYHFFGYLWTNEVINAMGCTTIAGAVASWYWASEFEAEKRDRMPSFPVTKAFGRTVRYHMGSLIFGSFIIALVQLVRYALMYLDKQTQGLQKKNPVVKVLMKLVHCCLWCFEKILKYITKNAYIMIAIHGTSFCTATKDAFMLLLNNLARMGVATTVSNLMILLGRLVIVALSALGCGAWVTVGDKNPSSIVVPVIVAAIVSWFVSGCFMSVYGLAIDTIMVSFCEDDQRNDGTVAKPYFMSDNLKRIVNKSNKMRKREVVDDSDDEDGGVKGDHQEQQRLQHQQQETKGNKGML